MLKLSTFAGIAVLYVTEETTTAFVPDVASSKSATNVPPEDSSLHHAASPFATGVASGGRIPVNTPSDDVLATYADHVCVHSNVCVVIDAPDAGRGDV